MAYSRFFESDIYLFWDVSGYINCMCCTLAPMVDTILKDTQMHGSTHFRTFTDAIEHMKAHQEVGDKANYHDIIARLMGERKMYGDSVAEAAVKMDAEIEAEVRGDKDADASS